jgi:hypothetical protein
VLGEAKLGDTARRRLFDIGLDEPGGILADRRSLRFTLAGVQVGVEVEVIVGQCLVPDRFDQTLERSRTHGIGERVPGRFAQLALALQLSGRQVDRVRQGGK